MFDKKMICNNIFFGVLLTFIWLYDYHYKLRYSKKISNKSLNQYNKLSEDFNKIKGQELQYKYKDVYYITLVNFKNIDPKVFDQIEKNLQNIYKQNFDNVHDYKVYFRKRKLKIGINQNFLDIKIKNYHTSHQHNYNFYFIYLTQDFYDKKITKKDNTISIKASKEKINDQQFLKDFLYKSIFYLKKINKLKHKNFNSLFNAYKVNLQKRYLKYIKSLNYINKNKNLAFLEKYLIQIENESNQYEKWFKSNDYPSIYKALEKEYIYIYKSHYMYEDYYFAMMIASVLLILSPIMRIATAEARNFIFDLLDMGQTTETEGIFYLIKKVFNFLLDN